MKLTNLKIHLRKGLTAASPALLAALVLFFISCGEKMELPSSPSSIAFSSGDTTYIHLAPNWTSNDGIPLSEPNDIVVGPDGYVFVSDRGNNRIAVFDRVGNTITASWTHYLDDLSDLPTPVENQEIGSITAIGQDEKLNLFMVTGDNIVWHWNQYINQYGVQSVLDYMVVLDTLEQVTYEWTYQELYEAASQAPDRYVPLDFIFDDDPEKIAAVSQPQIFYHEPQAKFRGVAGGPDETVYVCDEYDEVIRLNVVYDNIVILNNNYFGFTYTGEKDRVVATSGSGMGTTDAPAGIYIQVQGSNHFIYFTQTGPNFMAQKLREEGTGNFFSAFGADTDFMQLNRFSRPMDIWVAAQYLGNNWIFVADTDANRIQVFNPVGEFLMYAGVRKEQVEGVETEIFDELLQPEGVAHFEGILYVTDTGNNRIVRYALSTDVENIPGQ